MGKCCSKNKDVAKAPAQQPEHARKNQYAPTTQSPNQISFKKHKVVILGRAAAVSPVQRKDAVGKGWHAAQENTNPNSFSCFGSAQRAACSDPPGDPASSPSWVDLPGGRSSKDEPRRKNTTSSAVSGLLRRRDLGS